MPLGLTTRLEKLEFVDTCKPYELAPFTEFQLNVGLVETPIEPSDGDDKVGGTG
jgi:hypothetical protein